MNKMPKCDIDLLLQNSWLQVISLRQNPVFKAGEGLELWQYCVAEVERVQQALKAAHLSEESCQHILYAQCALLDEVVKRRGVEDDACVQWYNVPLQGHFLGTLEAGDELCKRMQDVLSAPDPDITVLTCFHRVMLLGFLGGYTSVDDPARQKLTAALAAQVPPFTAWPQNSELAAADGRRGLSGLLATLPLRFLLCIVVLAALWCGLNGWLHLTLGTLLSGDGK